MDLVDLRSGLAFGKTIEEIAEFLVRQPEEVRQKITTLSLNAGLLLVAKAGEVPSSVQ
jgi:hypothetical protein